jgi:chorismate-pyruvate lyase
MLSLAAQDDRLHRLLQTQPFTKAQEGITAKEFKKLFDVADARLARASRPLGQRVPPAKPFSHRTHSVEIDESAEAHLARGNQAFELRQYERAYDSYLAALDAAERA